MNELRIRSLPSLRQNSSLSKFYTASSRHVTARHAILWLYRSLLKILENFCVPSCFGWAIDSSELRISIIDLTTEIPPKKIRHMWLYVRCLRKIAIGTFLDVNNTKFIWYSCWRRKRVFAVAGPRRAWNSLLNHVRSNVWQAFNIQVPPQGQYTYFPFTTDS